MFRVLVTCDGSKHSDVTLFDLQKAGLPEKAEALIFSVADVHMPSDSVLDNPYMPPEYSFALENAFQHGRKAILTAESFVHEAQKTLKKYLPQWEIDTKVVVDSPAMGILEKAAEWKPDLLVLGSHGHSAVIRFLMGSVSQKVLNSAHCCVRITRGRIEENAVPVRLVIGVDGSGASKAAVAAVARRFWKTGTAAHLVAAVDARIATAIAYPDVTIKPWIHDSDKDPIEWVRRMMAEWEKDLKKAGLVVSSVVREGEPNHVLLHEAEHWGADCIFVGSRGLGMRDRIVLGSVSASVASRAHCSVEVIK